MLAPMVVFGSFVTQMLSVGVVRRSFDLNRSAPFLVGGALGVPAGAALLGMVNITVFKRRLASSWLFLLLDLFDR